MGCHRNWTINLEYNIIILPVGPVSVDRPIVDTRQPSERMRVWCHRYLNAYLLCGCGFKREGESDGCGLLLCMHKSRRRSGITIEY